MGFLRTIGRFIAGFLVLFGITLFIVSYLGSHAVKNINVLETDISSDKALNALFKDSGVDIEQLKQYCSEDLDNENCKIFSRNPILSAIEKQINEFRYYGNMMRTFGIIFFIIGLLLFIWCSGLIVGLRDASLMSFIGMVFSYTYFKFIIPSMLSKLLPGELIEIFNNWMTITLNQTLNMVLVLGAIFLILTVGLYILKNKIKTKEKSSMKQNGS